VHSGQRRKTLWTSTPLEQVLVFSKRLSFGRTLNVNEIGNGKIAFAWFVWSRDFRGETTIAWI
jgi:ABC-type Fe3+ transport system permease subunit